MLLTQILQLNCVKVPLEGKEKESVIRELVELLEYAYIGARYDPEYYITEDELKYLAKHVKKLHRLTEKICVAKIDSFI